MIITAIELRRRIMAKKSLCVIFSVILLISLFPFASNGAYENTYTNTGNQIEDLIAVATTQKGYCEGNTSSQLGGTVAGSGNYTKYGKWYGINPGAWCAMFVSWCANQAGIPTSVIPKHASCDIGMQWFKNKSQWHYSAYFGGSYTPKRGDIVYFGSNPSNLNDSTHVGIVTGVSGSYLYTIEGNKSNKCTTVTYSLSSSYIFGYGTPSYTDTSSSEENYSVGSYVITASSLNMRSLASTSGVILAVLSSGDYVEITKTSGHWGYCSYGTKQGWISLKYAIPVESIQYNLSENGIAFIEELEGYSQYAYWDNSQWSIGYGTGCGENEYPDGISKSEAETLLRSAVVKYEIYLNKFLYEKSISLNQNQYDALVSFTYNLGNIWDSSFTLRTYLINGISNYTSAQIKSAFGEKVYVSGVVNQGLVNRRNSEAELFLTSVQSEITKYTITLNPNGGTLSDDCSYQISYGEYYRDVIGGEIPVPTRAGYAFKGWYNEKHSYTLSVAESEYFAVYEDVVFIALWEEAVNDSYTVTYNANGGSEAPSSQSVQKGNSITLSSKAPTKSGYNFAGWATVADGECKYSLSETIIPDGNITLYAVWTECPWGTLASYLVTATSLNIRSGPSTSYSSLGTIPNGAVFNVTEISGSWGYATSNTANSLSGWVSISSSYSYRVVGIFYNLVNGGTADISAQIKKSGTDITLSSVIPQRKGYTFLGWSPDKNATAPTYLPGAEYTADEYINLYDIWQETEHSYSKSSSKSATCTADGEVIYTCVYCGMSYSVTLPATGHSFGDWYEETPAQIGIEGVAKRICTICKESETTAIPALPEEEIPETEMTVCGYKVSLTGASNINYIRFAPGELSTSAEIRASSGLIQLNEGRIAKCTTDDTFTYTMATGGIFTFWVRYKDMSTEIFYADVTNIEQTLSTDGLKITLEGLYGVKDYFISKGNHSTYRECKSSEYFAHITSNKINGAKAYSYTVTEPGEYTICVRYDDTDRQNTILHTTLDVTMPTFTQDGLALTVDGLKGARSLKYASGEWQTPSQIKRAEGYRGIGAAVGSKDSYTIKFASEGTYTISVEYTNGLCVVKTLQIKKS